MYAIRSYYEPGTEFAAGLEHDNGLYRVIPYELKKRRRTRKSAADDGNVFRFPVRHCQDGLGSPSQRRRTASAGT